MRKTTFPLTFITQALLLAILLQPFQSFGQKKPILLNGKLLNSKTLEPLNEERYHKVNFDKEGRIHVQHGPAYVWGTIDYEGNTLVKPRYNNQLTFSDGIAIGAISGFSTTYVAIDEQGNKLFNMDFNQMLGFKGDLAVVKGKDIKYGVANSKGKATIKPQYRWYYSHQVFGKDHYFVFAHEDEKAGIVNQKNKKLLPFKYDQITWVKDDIFLVAVPDAVTPTSKGGFGSTIQNYDYGLWSVSKGMIIEPTMDFVDKNFEFLEYGYVKVRAQKYGGWNLIDLTGKKILAEDHYDLTPVNQNLIGYGKKDEASDKVKYAIGDFKGSLKTQYQLASVEKLENGMIGICVEQGQQYGCGYLGEDFKLKIPLNYGFVEAFDASGHALVGRLAKESSRNVVYKGIIDKDNKIVLPLVFGEVEKVSDEYYQVSLKNNAHELLVNVDDGMPVDIENNTYVLRAYANFYYEFSDFSNAAKYYQIVANSRGFGNSDIAKLGKSYSRSGQYAKAIESLDKLLALPEAKLTKALKVYRGEMAYALWKQGKMPEAKEVYEKTFSEFTKTEKEAYSNMRMDYAEMLHAMNLGNEAIKQYEEVLRYYPSAWGVYDKLGVLQLTIDLKDESITSFNKSIGFNPNGKDAYFYRGQAYALKNEHIKAVADFEKAIQLEGSGELTTIHTYLADSYFSVGNKEKACGLWKQLAPYNEKAKAESTKNCN